MLLRSRVGLQLAALNSVIGWLTLVGAALNSVAGAQSLNARLGELTVPGVWIERPAVEAINGVAIHLDMPTAVLFTTIQQCGMCKQTTEAIARRRSLYPGLQFLFVVVRGTQDEIAAWAASMPDPVLGGAAAHSYMDAFDTSVAPVIYLLSAEGEVLEKTVIQDTGQLLKLDTLLDWIHAGEEDRVRAVASHPLVVGRPPGRMPAWFPQDVHGPTFVYVHNHGCTGCLDLVDGSALQTAFNELAEAHPKARFVVVDPMLVPAGPDGPWLPLAVESYRELEARFGPGFLSTAIHDLAFNGYVAPQLMNSPHYTSLPEDGWHPAVTLIQITRPGEADPRDVWGYPFSPGLLHFDDDGRFQGPYPYWNPGRFRLSALYEEILVRLNPAP